MGAFRVEWQWPLHFFPGSEAVILRGGVELGLGRTASYARPLGLNRGYTTY